MSACVATSEAVDPAVLREIVEGAYTPAIRAIGQANVPTLRLAADQCHTAITEARGHGEPWRQFRDREILCRARVRRIEEKRAESF